LHNEENEIHLSILALSTYNLILFFLQVEGMIDFEVVNVFQSVIALKINLEVAVLTKTCLFLNHYRK
jgi:hypothetical protein